MPLLLEWGEELDLSCVCVAETAFLLLLLLLASLPKWLCLRLQIKWL